MELETRKTLQDGRIVKIERGRKSSGQFLRYTVLMPSHRVVGVAEIQIPLMDGFSLQDKIGLEDARAIERDLEAIAVRVAGAVQVDAIGKSA